MRVLIADDDADIVRLIGLNLRTEGFEVIEAVNGNEAWALARSAAPDLVLLDVMMPERDGIDVLTSLKAHPRTKHIPVVLVTAKANDDDVWQGWRAGADYYMTKPFNLDELMRFVDMVLGPAPV
jgi:two-component system alkaline phosphatase synthesis response regulator PhoP